MTDDPVLEREAEAFVPEEERPPKSVLDQLGQAREDARQKQKEPLMLEVPGNGGLLFARYKPIPFKQSEILAKRLDQDKQVDSKTIAGSCDTLIAACLGIYVKDPEHPACLEGTDLRPIDPDAPVEVKFDSRLAQILNLESDETLGARGVVREVFLKNDYAIVRQNIEYSKWVQGIDKDNDEEFLGE